jgi:hypothetical protein
MKSKGLWIGLGILTLGILLFAKKKVSASQIASTPTLPDTFLPVSTSTGSPSPTQTDPVSGVVTPIPTSPAPSVPGSGGTTFITTSTISPTGQPQMTTAQNIAEVTRQLNLSSTPAADPYAGQHKFNIGQTLVWNPQGLLATIQNISVIYGVLQYTFVMSHNGTVQNTQSSDVSYIDSGDYIAI